MPAPNLTYRRIPVGDGATMAPLGKELMDELQDALRYGTCDRRVALMAASVISDYLYIVFCCSQRERNRRCQILKEKSR